MANTIIGQILAIGEVQNLVSQQGSPFTKRSLIVSVRRFDPNTGEPVNDYENTPEFSFIGDRCRDLDQFQVGQNVCVYFDLVGRKYTPQGGQTKIINDIRPYKVELYGRTANQPSDAPQQTAPVQQPQQPQNPNVAYGAQAQQQYQAPQHQQFGGFTPPI